MNLDVILVITLVIVAQVTLTHSLLRPYWIPYLYIGYCKIPECSVCRPGVARCTTTSTNEIVPNKLSKDTKKLFLTYSGPDVVLKQKMFSHLKALTELTISGFGVTAVQSGIFEFNINLRTLTIFSTSIANIPDRAFPDSNQLSHLHLFLNRKLNKLPVNLFSKVPHLKHLRFSQQFLSNEKHQCLNGSTSTIGEEFYKLTHLQQLDLFGYGVSCGNISDNFLKPLYRIRKLNLDHSTIFQGSPKILTSLENLEKLNISAIEPFRSCPALAVDVFRNIPAQVTELTMRSFINPEVTMFNESCIIGPDILQSLRNRKQILKLDLAFSYNIFGLAIPPSLFKGFNRLKYLDLSDCGIQHLQFVSFSHLKSLVELKLDNNMLNYPALLASYHGSLRVPTLRRLSLAGTGLRGDINIEPIRQMFPGLVSLSLSGIDLSFWTYSIYNQDRILLSDKGQTNSSKIKSLTVDNKRLLSFKLAFPTLKCEAMNLLNVSMKHSSIVDVSGLCSSIEILDLSVNELGILAKRNFASISRLVNLTNINLSSNFLDFLSATMFQNLSHLHTLSVSDNQIKSISAGTFATLSKLKILDLSSNRFTSFESQFISHLTNLEQLNLDGNRLTEMDTELLDTLTHKLPKLRVFTIVNNPLICSCLADFKNWVLNSNVVNQVKYINCTTPENRTSVTQLISYEPDIWYCFIRTPLTTAVYVLAGAIVSLFIGIPSYKYRWYIKNPTIVMGRLKETKFEHECIYDAFISYNTESEVDTMWVKDVLLPALEQHRENPATDQTLKVYVVDRDGGIGDLKMKSLCDAMEISRRLILVLTKSYLDSADCLREAHYLTGSDIKLDGKLYYNPDRIIIIKLEDFDEGSVEHPIESLLKTANVIEMMENPCKPRTWSRLRGECKPKHIYRKKTQERQETWWNCRKANQFKKKQLHNNDGQARGSGVIENC